MVRCPLIKLAYPRVEPARYGGAAPPYGPQTSLLTSDSNLLFLSAACCVSWVSRWDTEPERSPGFHVRPQTRI